MGLPLGFWDWKPEKITDHKRMFHDDIMVLRWNDVMKTKNVKFLSMLSTIHTEENSR